MIIFLFAGILQTTLKNWNDKRLNESDVFGILHKLLFFVYKSVHKIYEKDVEQFRVLSFN
jgi:hypothetical protein